ncbi:MAG: hypothetical protein MJ016_04470, partial [Victivallaceae bacterium]|nr:hypothetical protein [Victivallaceae bacterium]
ANGKPLVVYHGSDADFFVVSKDGVVIGGNSYQHGLITQFAEDHSSNRDNFAIVWESYGKTSKQPNRAQGVGSQGYAPSSSPGNINNISQKNGLSNLVGKKNQKNSGMPSVDPAAQLDPTLEDNMIEALLLPVQKAQGDISALLKLFSDRIAGFTDVDFRKLFRDMWKAVKEDRPYRQGRRKLSLMAKKIRSTNYYHSGICPGASVLTKRP